jgi:septal ring factor EnvC (AmiA/AmiB activator)
MSTSRLSKLLLPALIAGLVLAPQSLAADRSAKEKQLKTVLAKIEKLKRAIDVKEDSKSKSRRCAEPASSTSAS